MTDYNGNPISLVQRKSLRSFDGESQTHFHIALDSAHRLTRINDTRFGVRKDYVWNSNRSFCTVRYTPTADIFSEDVISVVL